MNEIGRKIPFYFWHLFFIMGQSYTDINRILMIKNGSRETERYRFLEYAQSVSSKELIIRYILDIQLIILALYSILFETKLLARQP